MGEIKSVKVDNWGVFFLQKLQNFFNKTDFCDLTLQFRDNSQLKVHRLVLSACTDFFNVLEQTCELIDDALVMPAELQADVVVPIVNFMYTGTLEFELVMYGKLLKTAKEMNMTVLLKLLEAHKRTMEISRTNPNKVSNQIVKKKPIPINANTKVIQQTQSVSSTQQPQQRVQHTITTPKRGIMKQMQDRITYKPASNTLLRAPPKLQRGPIRFEEPNSQTEVYESSFDSISYESKPLKEEPEDYMNVPQSSQWNRSSPFEQLRKGFNNNKRPAISTFTSPPAKKPNIEDVKEFSEQQRMRKQIAAEFGDDHEFDSIMDDEFHHDDDDEEPMVNVNPSPTSSSLAAKQQQQQQQQIQQQQQSQQSSMIIKQSPNEKPTIVVKDTTNSKMDHAKIISEVLRQYPHLVKSNKNIKLKIMPNVGGQSQKIVVKKEAIDNTSSGLEQSNETEKIQTIQHQSGSQKIQSIIKKPLRSYTSAVKAETQPKVIQTAISKSISEVKTTPSAAPQKRRIDSKTMHALISLGAENTTGPWLCLRCGVNGRPISIPSYRGFRRHLINTHKETIDAALCEYCGWRSKNNRELHYHMLTDHKVSSQLYNFPECKECNKVCFNDNELQLHGEQYHPDSHKQQCIYCNKVFVKEMNLYTHMKSFHKKRAREDGVIDFSDEEMEEELESQSSDADAKIKIISDIALPSTLLNLEEHATTIEEEEYANDSGPKFVNADGNEMVLTAEQREEIMSQLDQDHDGGVVMVLNDSVFPPDQGAEVSENDMKMKLEEHENNDEFNNQTAEFLTTSDGLLRETEMSTEEANKMDEDETQEQHESDNDERLDDEDHMEWAENLISAHDADEDDHEGDDSKNDDAIETDDEKDEKEMDKIKKESVSPVKSDIDEKTDPKKADDISLKLKMLTGDWTDDEIDEDEEETNVEQSEQHKEKAEESESIDPPCENEDDKSKSDDIATKIQDQAAEDYENEAEIEAESSLTAEDEITQSSHSEKVEEEDETIKKGQKEKLEETADTIKKSDDSTSELDIASTEESNKKENVSAAGGRTSRRTSSAKDKDRKNSETSENVSDSKTESMEKENDDDEGVDEKAKSPKVTEENKEGANTSTNSIKQEASETPEKVKSLLNEWADEEDDL